MLLVAPDMGTPDHVMPVLDRVLLPLASQLCSLKELSDLACLLKPQVLPMVKSVFWHLWLSHQLCPFLGTEGLVIVAHALFWFLT